MKPCTPGSAHAAGLDEDRVRRLRGTRGKPTSQIAQAFTPPNKERKLTTEFVRQDLAQNSNGTGEPDRVRVIRDGVASYLPDIDPEETGEWLESFDDLLERSGPSRARYLMLR